MCQRLQFRDFSLKHRNDTSSPLTSALSSTRAIMASTPHPSSTTVPANPSAKPPPSPSEPPSRRPQQTVLSRLRILLLRYIFYLARTTDRTLVRLSTLLSNPASTDALLATTSYALSLVHAVLSRLVERRLASLASTIAEKAEDVLLPVETLVATLPALEQTHILTQLAGATKAISAVIEDYRIFARLWGLVGLYVWARSTYRTPLPTTTDAGTSKNKERLLRTLVWAEIASLVAFQVLENGAYLASKGVLTSKKWTGEEGIRRETLWSMYSCRFWAAYVALELVRLGIERYYRPQGSSTQAPPTEDEKRVMGDGEKEGKLREEEKRRHRKKEDWCWWRDLVSNLGYMPMTLHWSVKEGLLGDWGIGVLGFVAGGALLVDAWEQTA